MDSKPFLVAYSPDGKNWTRTPEMDDDNYWWTARQAKNRSRILKRYERVIHSESGKIIVTFFDGMGVRLDENPGEEFLV